MTGVLSVCKSKFININNLNIINKSGVRKKAKPKKI